MQKNNKNIRTPDLILDRLLSISSAFNQACLLVSNKSNGEFDFMLALNAEKTITKPEEIDLYKNEYLFGHLNYDLKNNFEKLQSKNKDYCGFPDFYFYLPSIIIKVKGNSTIIYFNDQTTINDIENILLKKDFKSIVQTKKNIQLKSSQTKNEYLEKVETLKKHIKRGNIYEVNYCINFFAEQADINPEQTFIELNQISKSPFACYYKLNDKYLLCSSPERFLQKKNDKIISQPIKGTRKRGQNKAEDEQIINELKSNKKEQNENVMIVDLVRNDLSRIASRGSVKVEELFGVYSFEQVHQMISTVSCKIKDNLSFYEIIKNTFPMGSMTGAPKIKAMELIDEHEIFRRGIYSGSVGYITPEGNFDFNVVIRSILYNSTSKTISINVGSAITDKAVAEEEYEECMLKAKAMINVLNN